MSKKNPKVHFSFPINRMILRFTLRMVSPIAGTGRNLTTDNWYTSVPLAEDLLKMKVTLVGTMKKNKPDIPPEMMPNKNR